eukprot:GEMP01014096.1.p1 GENE.GEMP01014096.1~~GEMP01014096.1.p1  ORF type:complete len:707 (+),score=164.75 GEMP01014096.1:50-2122(+)
MTTDAKSADDEPIRAPITVECTLLNGSPLLLHECVTVLDVRVKAAMHFGTHYPYICVVPLQCDTTQTVSLVYPDDALAPSYCHIINTEATAARPPESDDIDWRAVVHSHAWHGDRAGVRSAAGYAIRKTTRQGFYDSLRGLARSKCEGNYNPIEPFLTQVMCMRIERARAIGTSTTVANAVHCLLDCNANADCGPALTLACVRGDAGVVALLLQFKAMSNLGDAFKSSIVEGQRDVVELLLGDSPCRVNVYENIDAGHPIHASRSTPMGDAIGAGNRAIVNQLLADPRCSVTVDHFFLAIRGGDKGIFDALLGHAAQTEDSGGNRLHALVHVVDNVDRDTALITATQYGHKHLVEAMVSDYSCPITQCNSERETPVMVAVQYARDDILAFLLTHDTTQDAVNIPSAKGLSPLIRAVYLHRNTMISLLIEHDADVNMTTSCGNTALHVAMTVGSDVNIVRTLLIRGCAVNAANDAGQAPLHLACGRRGRQDETIVQVLVEFQAMVNMHDGTGRTPLVRAVDGGNCAAVRQLVAAGACVDAGLLVAVQRGMEDLVKILLEGKGDVNAARDEVDGRTSLMIAAHAGRTAIVEDLLDARADITTISKNGRNAAWWASRSGHSHIVEILRQADDGSEAQCLVNDGMSQRSGDRQSIGDDTREATRESTGEDVRRLRSSVTEKNERKSRSKKGKRK